MERKKKAHPKLRVQSDTEKNKTKQNTPSPDLSVSSTLPN